MEGRGESRAPAQRCQPFPRAPSHRQRDRASAADEPIAGDVLIRFAQEQSVDLIVAGAYGHSRLGDWIFGGVTRALLTGSSVCCLFSH